MLSVVVGFISLLLGLVMIWKPGKFVELVGEQGWMRKFLGEGRGTTGYKLVGLIIIFVSFLIMFGLIEGILVSIFAPVTGAGR